MDITLYKVDNNSIVNAGQETAPNEWQKKAEWIDIRTDNRDEVVEYFKEHSIFSDILNCIAHPEQFPFSITFGDVAILNFSASNLNDIYEAENVSVIIASKLVITIIPKNNDLLSQRILLTFEDKKFPLMKNFLFYEITSKILAEGNANMAVARGRLQSLERVLITNPEDLSSQDLMECERDINQLSDIIEDQYVGFELLVSLRSTNKSLGIDEVAQASKLIKGFEPLNKAMSRLEKKAESLRLQYMIIQQEKSTRKINLLTIIQAVFVPLTFIAGVYGMNFVNMPELNWTHGYLFVWLVFAVLGLGLMAYFYRKGWFD